MRSFGDAFDNRTIGFVCGANIHIGLELVVDIKSHVRVRIPKPEIVTEGLEHSTPTAADVDTSTGAGVAQYSQAMLQKCI